MPRYHPLSATRRGYGRDHRATRKLIEPTVSSGQATCWRCGQRILPDQPWDLGHDDADRTKYRGPEHARARDCPAGGNRATMRADRHDPKPRQARWT